MLLTINTTARISGSNYIQEQLLYSEAHFTSKQIGNLEKHMGSSKGKLSGQLQLFFRLENSLRQRFMIGCC